MLPDEFLNSLVQVANPQVQRRTTDTEVHSKFQLTPALQSIAVNPYRNNLIACCTQQIVYVYDVLSKQ